MIERSAPETSSFVRGFEDRTLRSRGIGLTVLAGIGLTVLAGIAADQWIRTLGTIV